MGTSVLVVGFPPSPHVLGGYGALWCAAPAAGAAVGAAVGDGLGGVDDILAVVEGEGRWEMHVGGVEGELECLVYRRLR